VARNNTLAEESKLDPLVSTTPGIYDGEPGDVVIDTNTLLEYLWVSSDYGWTLLGNNVTGYKLLQDPVTDPTVNGATDNFIDSIT
jgi:hypothetical protein